MPSVLPEGEPAPASGELPASALEGFSDAGHAIRLAAQHLKNTLDTELVASFVIDELLDYRSRRPLMTFKTDHFTHYEQPELSLYALHDSVGTPFLLLAGMEPDLRWERFITAVRLLAERTRVVAEGAGALALAAALAGRAGDGRVVCVVSGGNIDLSTLVPILEGRTP